MTLAGKTALVTGSTSGIGLGIAEFLAKAGADIVLNGMGDATQIESIGARIAADHGVKVRFLGADMSRPEAIEAMFQALRVEFGSVDILVNNAGIQHVAPIEEFPAARWDPTIAINLSAAFHTIRHALPGMRQKQTYRRRSMFLDRKRDRARTHNGVPNQFAPVFFAYPMQLRQIILCLVLIAAGAVATVLAQEMNGFDLKGSLIPSEQIHFGGPAKDGIPAIDKPDFVAAGSAPFVRDSDAVLGLVRGGVARAYPIRILNWHEVVNDRVDNDAVVITFCPLCGTGVAFDARIDSRVLSFGVSGLLYNSDVLLYDRQTQSLWSQLLGQAISGPMKGRRMMLLPLTHTTWADWRKSHSATQVLSPNTGQTRPYDRDPYAGYQDNEEIMFPVAFRAAGYHPKERVLGVSIGEQSKAYPFVELSKTAGVVSDRIGDTALTIRFDRKASRATAHTPDGQQLPAVVGYWFAWYAFHPKTAVFRAGEQLSPKRKP